MNVIKYTPIGIIHSPFGAQDDVPGQSSLTDNNEGVAELFPEYAEGIQGIEKFSQILLIVHLHLSQGFTLKVKPHNSEEMPRGVFTTRTPRRPNAIGISVVRLMNVEGGKLYFHGVDLIDGTPILDIKPVLK